MANPIFHSAYTAQQIEDEITNGVPKVVNGYWYRWGISTGAWVNTGVKSGVEPPYVVTLAADMTDTGLTYIYIGSEAGYTFGHWYYWDGVQWADGGAFLAAPADSELSFTSANAVQNKVIAPVALNAYPTATIEDAAMASFTDGADGIPPKTLILNIDPVQTAGTPSPTDPLPITGWTAANIVVSPTQDAGDGTTYTVNWQNEAGTVYGGSLTDNGDDTWTLTVTHRGIKASDVGTWQLDGGTVYQRSFNATNTGGFPKKNGLGNVASDSYPTRVAEDGFEIRGASSSSLVKITDRRFENDAASFNAATANIQIVYELATPLVYTLTAGSSVTTLLGDNNIFVDTGNIAELTYRADPTLYINGKINAVMALIAEI